MKALGPPIKTLQFVGELKRAGEVVAVAYLDPETGFVGLTWENPPDSHYSSLDAFLAAIPDDCTLWGAL